MKIAHVLRRLSFKDWGGTEQVVWNIAVAQAKAGHDVRLFATTALCGNLHETVSGLEIFRFRPVYPWFPMTAKLSAELDRKGGNPFVPGLGRALEEWRPDVIHCHAMARIAELCLRTAAKIGAKCAISLHGGGANVPLAEAKSLKAPTRGLFPWGKILDVAMRWTRRVPEDFDGIVCVGEDEYQAFKSRGFNAIYLPNGVDSSLFAGEGARKTRHGGLTRLLCVARIDRQKNQMMLVEALGRRRDIEVRLVGPVTQPDYKTELEKRAEELGVSQRLSFVGSLAPASKELVNEYRNSDVFVLPSRHEPFGIVVLEAWASGLPVVASDVGGLGRLCSAHPGAAVLFRAGDEKGFDEALEKAMKNGDSLGAAGLSASRQYDWGVLSAKLEAFYLSM